MIMIMKKMTQKTHNYSLKWKKKKMNWTLRCIYKITKNKQVKIIIKIKKIKKIMRCKLKISNSRIKQILVNKIQKIHKNNLKILMIYSKQMINRQLQKIPMMMIKNYNNRLQMIIIARISVIMNKTCKNTKMICIQRKINK